MATFLGILSAVIVIMSMAFLMFFMPNTHAARLQRIEADARQAEWQLNQITQTALSQMLDEARRHRQ